MMAYKYTLSLTNCKRHIPDVVATLEGIQRGLEQMERGEGKPAAEFFAEFRDQFGIKPMPRGSLMNNRKDRLAD